MEDKDKTKKGFGKTNPNIVKELAPYMNLGLQMALTIGLFALLGWWLDAKFETKPWLVTIGAIFGVVVALYSFFKTVSLLEAKRKSILGKDKKI